MVRKGGNEVSSDSGLGSGFLRVLVLAFLSLPKNGKSYHSHIMTEKVMVNQLHILGLGGFAQWFYGVMVSTQDSESCDPSSNLGRTCEFFFLFVDHLSYLQKQVALQEDLAGGPRQILRMDHLFLGYEI